MDFGKIEILGGINLETGRQIGVKLFLNGLWDGRSAPIRVFPEITEIEPLLVKLIIVLQGLLGGREGDPYDWI